MSGFKKGDLVVLVDSSSKAGKKIMKYVRQSKVPGYVILETPGGLKSPFPLKIIRKAGK